MILKKLEFHCINSNDEYAYSIKKRAKFITNYINRNCLKPLKFNSVDFDMIVIYLTKNVVEPYIQNKGLCVSIFFDRDYYDKINTVEEYFDYYNKCIEKAFDMTRQKNSFPENEITGSLKMFKENGYKNSWEYKSKSIKELKAKITLNCEMTMEKFMLVLKITKNGMETMNKTILETDPDEVAFHYRFKDIVVENNKIIVTDKIGGKLYETYL